MSIIIVLMKINASFFFCSKITAGSTGLYLVTVWCNVVTKITFVMSTYSYFSLLYFPQLMVAHVFESQPYYYRGFAFYLNQKKRAVKKDIMVEKNF